MRAEHYALVTLKCLQEVLCLEFGGEVVYLHDVRELIISEVDVFVFVVVASVHVVVVEPWLLHRFLLFAVLKSQLGGDASVEEKWK